MKTIIFDSGALISLVMAGLLPELKELKKTFDGKFLITEDVKREVIDKPMGIKRFELEALKVQALLNEEILEMPDSLEIKTNEINKERDRFMEIANSIMITKKRPVSLIHLGESSCLALSKILTDKGIENLIAIDERTTRLLSEKPDNLKKIMEGKLHMQIQENKENYKYFKNFRFIRSTELMYVAYKKGIMRWKDKNLLEAVLYALKFKGTAISEEEIKEIKQMG